MVSGIGPKATLDKFNISVVADRCGVGQNLWVCKSKLVVYITMSP